MGHVGVASCVLNCVSGRVLGVLAVADSHQSRRPHACMRGIRCLRTLAQSVLCLVTTSVDGSWACAQVRYRAAAAAVHWQSTHQDSIRGSAELQTPSHTVSGALRTQNTPVCIFRLCVALCVCHLCCLCCPTTVSLGCMYFCFAWTWPASSPYMRPCCRCRTSTSPGHRMSSCSKSSSSEPS